MSGDEMRNQRMMDAPCMTYDIPELVRRLKAEDTWKHSDRNSLTLNMGEGLRLVIVALHSGAEIKPHKAEHPISVQALEGEFEFAIDEKTEVLKAGQVLTLHKGITHRVKARSECAFLITLGA